MFQWRASLTRTKVYDVVMAAPLVAAYAWVLFRDGPALAGQYDLARAAGFPLEAGISLLGHTLSLAVAALLIALVFVRSVPVLKSTGLVPKLVALAGAFGGVSLFLLPEASPPLWLETASVVTILAGLAGMIVSFLWLNRAFSVLPEARCLVTRGPYALVRHPVYLFEEIAFFGMMLQFAQPWAFLIFAIQCGFQLARIPYEERVLGEAFPEYESYAARTPRLIPGLY